MLTNSSNYDKGQKVGYIRVSTADQNTARQLEGVQLDRVFTDRISGKDTNRQALNQMIEYVRSGDIVFVHSLDRLARSINDLIQIISKLRAKNVTVTFLSENLSLGSDVAPHNELMIHLLGCIAEFERKLLLQRQYEGIQLAKKAGKYKGRKPKLNDDQLSNLKAAYLDNPNFNRSAWAKENQVSRITVIRMLKKVA